jgi:hypothetical protein
VGKQDAAVVEVQPTVLDEFRRCLRDDGTLLVGFFVGNRLEPFPHTVTTAYSWPVDELTQVVTDAGFVVRDVQTRPNSARPDRWHGSMVAERTSAGWPDVSPCGSPAPALMDHAHRAVHITRGLSWNASSRWTTGSSSPT